MSQSVLTSIQPKWCELIASGKKTVMIRKTKPKIETPFKVYIYCTKGRGDCLWRWDGGIWYDIQFPNERPNRTDGTVIGEFVCKKIDRIGKRGFDNNFDYCYLSLNVFGNDDIEIEITDIKKSCIKKDELNSYGSNSNVLYAWHISDLKIYDKSRDLSEFVVKGDCSCENCRKCKWIGRGNGYSVEDDCLLPYTNSSGKAIKPLFRPPASWCYVEEVKNDG